MLKKWTALPIFNVSALTLISFYITILAMLEHPNIVKLIEVLATNSKIYIVMELVTEGDLFERIR